MAKLGIPYQNLVAEIASALHPDATIKVGEWVIGPDGRREIDVSVRAVVEGTARFILIECKDWNSRVGITAIDALESKRNDLKADQTIMVSNKGFTKNAIQKGNRTNIACYSAVKQSADIINFAINRPLYAQQFYVAKNTFTVHGDGHGSRFDAKEYFYEGRSFAAWLRDRSDRLLRDNKSARSIRNIVTFKQPLSFSVNGKLVTINRIHSEMRFGSRWLVQYAREQITRGFYDHGQSFAVVPAKESWSTIIDTKGWKPVRFKKKQKMIMRAPPKNGIGFALELYSMPYQNVVGPAPDLDQFIEHDESVTET